MDEKNVVLNVDRTGAESMERVGAKVLRCGCTFSDGNVFSVPGHSLILPSMGWRRR